MFTKIVQLVKHYDETYILPEWYKPRRIHDMMCTCGSTRCFGYTSDKWLKVPHEVL